MTIQVLGSGCPNCKRLYELTKQAVAELGLKTDVEYVTDIEAIIKMGILQTPAVTVDGRVVLTGFTPDINRIKKSLT